MRKLCFILPALFVSSLLWGQLPTDTILTKAEKMPYFTGCNHIYDNDKARRICSNNELVRFISNHLVYPEEAMNEGVQGTVLVSFVINEKGEVTSPAVLKEIGAGCGEAALDVVRKMPTWEPAMQNGETVKFRLNLPVQFNLRAEERDRAELFSLTWGTLSNYTTTVEELSKALDHAVRVRGPEGDTRFVDELEFIFERRNRQYTGTGRGVISDELEGVVEKAKKGGTFTIRASVQEGGEFVTVVRSFKVVK